jgi:membrane-associated phospholipid phosphatase
VGVSRLGAQQHWLSDIFVGSAVGFLAGRYVYKQHHDPSLPGSIASKLRPQFAAREHGLGLYWDF